jgi:O-antigen ligase
VAGFDKLDIISYAAYTLPECAIVVVVAFLVMWSFWGLAKSVRCGLPLWIVTSCYFTLYSIAMLFPGADDINRALCSPVVLSLAFGLAASRIAGSSERIVLLLAIVGALLASYSLFSFANDSNVLVSGSVRRAGGVFNAPLELAYALLLCIPASVYFTLKKTNSLLMGVSIVACAIVGASLYLTLSWMSICAVSFGLLLFARESQMSKAELFTLAAACAVVCGIVGLRRIVGHENAVSALGSWGARTSLWVAGLHLFVAHPLTGVGLGNVSIPAVRYLEGSARQVGMIKCMNLPLQWMDEMGVGGLFFLAAFCTVLHGRLNQARSLVQAVFASTLVALAIVCFLDVPVGVCDQTGPTCLFGVILGGILLLPGGELDSKPLAQPDTPAETRDRALIEG